MDMLQPTESKTKLETTLMEELEAKCPPPANSCGWGGSGYTSQTPWLLFFFLKPKTYIQVSLNHTIAILSGLKMSTYPKSTVYSCHVSY